MPLSIFISRVILLPLHGALADRCVGHRVECALVLRRLVNLGQLDHRAQGQLTQVLLVVTDILQEEGSRDCLVNSRVCQQGGILGDSLNAVHQLNLIAHIQIEVVRAGHERLKVRAQFATLLPLKINVGHEDDRAVVLKGLRNESLRVLKALLRVP